jgi:very-short-patch-repair endonuclease
LAEFLAKTGVTTDGASILAEAAANLAKALDVGQEEQARSAAERFLFEVLESWMETTCQFRLNQRLEFPHGNASAEGDLVAPASRLVIELDGSYHHLADPDAYRRDRRKDYSYQRHGYLVLRFLSEDIVTRLEEILQTIREALAHQKLILPKQRLDS